MKMSVLFLDTIVWRLGDEFVVRASRRLARGSVRPPVGTVARIIKYDEAAREQKAINVLEITPRLFVCVGSVNIGQRNRTTKRRHLPEEVNRLDLLCPKAKKLVGTAYNVMG